MSYDEEDRLLTAGETQHQYSADGFLTQKTRSSNSTQYEYSSRGELLHVDLPDGTSIDYTYGPLGRRLSKSVNGTVTRKYLWQGLTKLLAVYDGSDNLLMRFEYADGRTPVAMTKGGQKYYLISNQVGSLRAVVDASGNLVKRIDYDSFGNVIQDTNPSFEIPFRFAGGLYDKHTGLIRFGHRDYDPDTGRWTAKDPILFQGGSTYLYGYCLNDPVNEVDPEGLFGSSIPGDMRNPSSTYMNNMGEEADSRINNAKDAINNDSLILFIDISAQVASEKIAKETIGPVTTRLLFSLNTATILFDPMPPKLNENESKYLKNNYDISDERPCK